MPPLSQVIVRQSNGIAAPTVDLIYGMAVGNPGGEKLHIGPVAWVDGRRPSSFCRRALQSTYRPLVTIPVASDTRWCKRCLAARLALNEEIDAARSQTPYLSMARDAVTKELRALRATLD